MPDIQGGDIFYNLRIGKDDVTPALNRLNVVASRSGGAGGVGGATMPMSGGGLGGPAIPTGGGGVSGSMIGNGGSGVGGGSSSWSSGSAPSATQRWIQSFDQYAPRAQPTGQAPAVTQRWMESFDPNKKQESSLLGQLNAIGLAYTFRRAAMSGPAGIAGWAVGAGLGALTGIGSMGGSLVGSLAGTEAFDMAGVANPGEKSKFDRAYADLKATIGRNLTPLLKASTDVTRFVADTFAGGRGQSFGAAPDENLGRRLGSPQDVYSFVQQQMLSQSPLDDTTGLTMRAGQTIGMIAGAAASSLGGGSAWALGLGLSAAWIWGTSRPSQPQAAS